MPIRTYLVPTTAFLTLAGGIEVVAGQTDAPLQSEVEYTIIDVQDTTVSHVVENVSATVSSTTDQIPPSNTLVVQTNHPNRGDWVWARFLNSSNGALPDGSGGWTGVPVETGIFATGESGQTLTFPEPVLIDSDYEILIYQRIGASDSNVLTASLMADNPFADVDLPPPGRNATAAEVSDYLQALYAQGEVMVHQMGDPLMAEHMAAMALVPRSASDAVAIDSGDWSDPTIWQTGAVPAIGDRVLIPEGAWVTYSSIDVTEFFTVRVDGKLAFAPNADSQMIFDTMVVTPTGIVEVGTLDQPVQAAHTVDLIIADNGPIDVAWDPTLLSRGIVSHGEMKIHGAQKFSHAKVAVDPMAGDTSITMAAAPAGWVVGDTIVIAGTRHEAWKWDNSIRTVTYNMPEDEERIITAINGNVVSFDGPLVHDHDTPRPDLKTSVANYTRNVRIRTENPTVPSSQRGHVMFMHSDNLDVRYAAFHELGRTDKSVRSFPVGKFNPVMPDSNAQGRYPLHLHRTGFADLNNPSMVVGNAVYGSPGWGYVHHDSNAIFSNNASYDTFGAGYVAETGNETGSWDENIAIFARGFSPDNVKNSNVFDGGEFDTARNGDGFWFQGRLVAANNNVAASTTSGYSYMHRDTSIDPVMIPVKPAHFPYPDALRNQLVPADRTPILGFEGNEAFGVMYGLQIVKRSPHQGHNIWSHLKDFTAWSVKDGVFIDYVGKYVLEGFDLVGKDYTEFNPPVRGLHTNNNIILITLVRPKVSGFDVAVQFKKHLTENFFSDDASLHGYVVIEPEITNSVTEYEDYDPDLDRIITDASTLPNISPSLDIDGPLVFFRSEQGQEGANMVRISGTKTSSLGQSDFVGGNDNADLRLEDVVLHLEKFGYWEQSSGERYFLIRIHYSDRITGEVFYETHPVFIDNGVELGSGYWFPNAVNNGLQDITTSGGSEYAGQEPLRVRRAAIPFEQF